MGKIIDEAARRDSLRALLVRTKDERNQWESLKESGATDEEIGALIEGILPRNGRSDSKFGVASFKVKPLRFWFGSYAVGEPEFGGDALKLIAYIREVFDIPAAGQEPSAPAQHAMEAAERRALPLSITFEPEPEQLSFSFDFTGLTDDDTDAIKRRTVEIRSAYRQGFEITAQVGDALRDVKRRLERGRWKSYLKEEFNMSVDTADRWIAVKELAEKDPHFAENLYRLPKGVQYLMAAPSTSDEARAEILDRAEAGETVTRVTGQAVVDAHKPSACRVCGCTMLSPCVDVEVDTSTGEAKATGETCAWADEAETLCTRCEAMALAEPHLAGRATDDLLAVLKASETQLDELIEMGFAPELIDRALQERLIDKTIKGKCSYVWSVADVVRFVTEQGSPSRLQLERAGCQIGAIIEAERMGAIVKRNGSWEIPTSGRKAGAEPREETQARSPVVGGNVRPESRLEDLLKGRELVVTFHFNLFVKAGCAIGVRVGPDPKTTETITIEAAKVRGFQDEVMELISKQLAAKVKAKKPAAKTAKKPVKKAVQTKPARKGRRR